MNTTTPTPFGPRADKGYVSRKSAQAACDRLNVSDVDGAALTVGEEGGRFYVMLTITTAS